MQIGMTASNKTFRDLAMLVEVADPIDLPLRHPVAGAKFSPDLMEKSPGRPPVGVQGRILDAMDDETITRKQASSLLDEVHRRIRGDAPGLSVVDDNGNLTPIRMEAVVGTRP